MTCEQIAELIQEGGNDELLPLLWDKTKAWYSTQKKAQMKMKLQSFSQEKVQEKMRVVTAPWFEDRIK